MVRDRAGMVDRQARFVADARSMPYRRFEASVRRWERLTDQDGTEPAADKDHEQRDAKLTQDFNTSWVLAGSFASVQGAVMRDILAHYINAELLADWEEARDRHGEAATDDHLPRTAAQRRADALARIFEDAAASAGSPVPAATVHTIVWSATAFEEMVRRLDAKYDRAGFDVDSFRCDPGNGAPVCGRHNRLKTVRTFRVWRDPTGTWHTQTPNGRHLD